MAGKNLKTQRGLEKVMAAAIEATRVREPPSQEQLQAQRLCKLLADLQNNKGTIGDFDPAVLASQGKLSMDKVRQLDREAEFRGVDVDAVVQQMLDRYTLRPGVQG